MVTIAPKEALGYANLGLVYTRMGKYKKAESQFHQALKIAPNDPKIQLNFADMLILTNRGEQAIYNLEETASHMDEFLKIIPEFPNEADLLYRKSLEYMLQIKYQFISLQ